MLTSQFRHSRVKLAGMLGQVSGSDCRQVNIPESRVGRARDKSGRAREAEFKFRGENTKRTKWLVQFETRHWAVRLRLRRADIRIPAPPPTPIKPRIDGSTAGELALLLRHSTTQTRVKPR